MIRTLFVLWVITQSVVVEASASNSCSIFNAFSQKISRSQKISGNLYRSYLEAFDSKLPDEIPQSSIEEKLAFWTTVANRGSSNVWDLGRQLSVEENPVIKKSLISYINKISNKKKFKISLFPLRITAPKKYTAKDIEDIAKTLYLASTVHNIYRDNKYKYYASKFLSFISGYHTRDSVVDFMYQQYITKNLKDGLSNIGNNLVYQDRSIFRKNAKKIANYMEHHRSIGIKILTRSLIVPTRAFASFMRFNYSPTFKLSKLPSDKIYDLLIKEGPESAIKEYHKYLGSYQYFDSSVKISRSIMRSLLMLMTFHAVYESSDYLLLALELPFLEENSQKIFDAYTSYDHTRIAMEQWLLVYIIENGEPSEETMTLTLSYAALISQNKSPTIDDNHPDFEFIVSYLNAYQSIVAASLELSP